MKVLILGSSGQLGACLHDQLSNAEHQIIFSSREDTDVVNFSLVRQEILKRDPDVVINCTAYTAVDKAEKNFETANLVNNLAVENLAKVCEEIRSVLVHISTDYVYDGKSEYPYKENSPTGPLNIYGKTKLLGDIAIQRSNVKYLIIRTGWVFSEYGNNFMKTMLKLRNQKKEISVISDQYGCPTYAQDIAYTLKITLNYIESGNCQYGLYHFSGSEPCSWYEFAKEINKLGNFYKNTNSKIIPVMAEDFETQVERPKYSVLDNNKIKRAFDVNSSDWRSGISRVLSLIQT